MDESTARAQSEQARHRINVMWLTRLRWGAVIGQAAVIAYAYLYLQIPLPLVPIALILAFEVAVNLVSTWWVKTKPANEALVGVLLELDTLSLTGLLYWSGGPYNPFYALYLLHIALAAVVLRHRLAWTLVALTLLCFGLLFLDHVPLDISRTPFPELRQVTLQLAGMWAAFVLAAIFITYFLRRVTDALNTKEQELARARELTARNEKLTSLATLAAGAAHELATPLATIAVVARELERLIEREHMSFDMLSDARLIRQQVERCRDVLNRMATDAGVSAADAFVRIPIGDLLRETIVPLPDNERIAIQVDSAFADKTICVPRLSVMQALRAVLKNAIDATRLSDPPQENSIWVWVEARLDNAVWSIVVRDRAGGMPDAVLARAGEPFFTTKGPGHGMGLGLFLTRAVFERLGGSMRLESNAGIGTTCTLVIPVEESEAFCNMEPLSRVC